MKSLIILFTSFTISLFAQIDTSVWYPMATGNYWEYQDSGLYVRKGISIVGDTLMTNGITYKIFRIKDLISNQIGYSYRRSENNSYLYLCNRTNEYKFYDFSKNVPESWRIDSIYNRRVVKKDSVWVQLFQKKLPRMEFENLYFTTNNDTIYIERSWQQIYKGVGDVILGEWGGYVELVGAIINGQRYGTITSVRDEKNIPSSFILWQNHPNPFNPTTKINYSIPQSSHVRITIYNILGQVVNELVDEEKLPGNYEVKFNGSNFTAGVYFYRLQAGDPSLRSGQGFTETKKLVLIK